MKEKRIHIEITAPIREMADAVELSSLVPIDSGLIAEVTADDPNPRFVISEIEEQQSKRKIDYDTEALELIADQVNKTKPTGYLGHIKDQDKDTAFPFPQVLWLGSKVVKGSGKARIITKGYLLPEGKARDLIKRQAINTVSWAGDASLVPKPGGGFKIKEFLLESIDFARKNREGMGSQNLVLVTEMMGDEDKGGKVSGTADESLERIVSQITIAELKTLNPGLFRSITEMVKDEVKTETDTAVQAKADELTQKHEQEIKNLPEVSLMQKLKELLKVEDISDSVDAVIALMDKLDSLGKQVVQEWFNNDILAKKVPNEKARKLVGRLIPVTEMQGDWHSESGREKIKTDLEARVDDALENDDEIKVIVKEMGSERGGLRLASHTRNDDDNRGGGNNDDDKDKRYKENSNVSVESVPVG